MVGKSLLLQPLPSHNGLSARGWPAGDVRPILWFQSLLALQQRCQQPKTAPQPSQF